MLQPSYLAHLLANEKLAVGIKELWPDLERILLCIQRNPALKPGIERPALCEAVDEIINILQIFSQQGAAVQRRNMKAVPQNPL